MPEMGNVTEVPDLADVDAPRHILLRSPEIKLKGRNQGDFRAQLRANAHRRLRRLGIDWPVKTFRTRLYLRVPPGDEGRVREVMEVLGAIPGVDTLVAAYWLSRERVLPGGRLNEPLLEETAVRLAQSLHQPGHSYAVRVRRAEKRFPRKSTDVEAWIGDAIGRRTSWDRVRLDGPDRTFHLDIYSDGIFLYAEKHKGVGGLPVGMSAHVLSLLSGGIDSPVASFLLARRGCTLDLFHMSAVNMRPADFDGAAIGKIAAHISQYTLRSRLFVVPYTYFDLALPEQRTGCEPVLFRRFLFRVGENLARRVGAAAMVTGDCLGQVASQTMENLNSSDRAISTPVLRPLIGFDKYEIMDRAREIGTFELSMAPIKDCCALFAQYPRTKTHAQALRSLEKRSFADYDEMLERSLSDAVWAQYDCGELVGTSEKLEDAKPPQRIRWRRRGLPPAGREESTVMVET